MYELQLHGVTVDTRLPLDVALSLYAESSVSRWCKQLYLLKPNGTKSKVILKPVIPVPEVELPVPVPAVS